MVKKIFFFTGKVFWWIFSWNKNSASGITALLVHHRSLTFKEEGEKSPNAHLYIQRQQSPSARLRLHSPQDCACTWHPEAHLPRGHGALPWLQASSSPTACYPTRPSLSWLPGTRPSSSDRRQLLPEALLTQIITPSSLAPYPAHKLLGRSCVIYKNVSWRQRENSEAMMPTVRYFKAFSKNRTCFRNTSTMAGSSILQMPSASYIQDCAGEDVESPESLQIYCVLCRYKKGMR